MSQAKIVCLEDFRDQAFRNLSKEAFAYIDQGSQQGRTLAENISFFRRILIVPRVLKFCSQISISANIFGRKCNVPFGFAPWAMNKLSHPDGQCIPAKIAAERNTIYTLSILSNRSLSQVSTSNSKGMRFQQVYISKDWDLNQRLFTLAQKYGFSGLVITVDAQVLGIRAAKPRQQDNLALGLLDELLGKSKTSQSKFLSDRDLSLNWETIKRIREKTKLKIILKGILHPKDAQIAVGYCDAIWVSNHGGRQLDIVQSACSQVAAIKKAVGSRVLVFVDGGIRSGEDVFKCLAFGADFVFIGRPVAYALTLGEPGVNKMMDLLQDQLRRTMALTGCLNLQEIRKAELLEAPSL